MSHLPLLSLVVVARDEATSLPNLLADILAQNYPPDRVELILVDSCSQDLTREIMEKFAAEYPARAIKVLNNQGLILSSGINVALREVHGEIILRIDAHAKIQRDFFRKNIDRVLAGEKIVGGSTLTMMPEKGRWKRLLALADQSRFGGSPAAARNPGISRYVDTLGYPAFHRSVFEKVGGFDERLVRNQDNEIYFRMKRAGFQFFFDSEICSFHVARSSLWSLLQQKYRTGVWIGLTLGISPKCFGVRHFVPALFVIACLTTFLIGIVLSWIPLVILGSIYLLGAVFFSLDGLRSAPRDVRFACGVLPIVSSMVE